jgi:hypothetical protein
MTALDGVNGTVCNAQQYQQFLQPNDNRSPSITCLTHGESIGLAVSIRFICLCPKLIPCTADSRSVVPQLRFYHRHIYMDWCTSDLLSCVCPV